jgi:hypothetical protein
VQVKALHYSLSWIAKSIHVQKAQNGAARYETKKYSCEEHSAAEALYNNAPKIYDKMVKDSTK